MALPVPAPSEAEAQDVTRLCPQHPGAGVRADSSQRKADEPRCRCSLVTRMRGPLLGAHRGFAQGTGFPPPCGAASWAGGRAGALGPAAGARPLRPFRRPERRSWGRWSPASSGTARARPPDARGVWGPCHPLHRSLPLSLALPQGVQDVTSLRGFEGQVRASPQARAGRWRRGGAGGGAG